MNGGELSAKTKYQNIKTSLAKQTETAIERGVFGVPTMFIGDELFWGVDQLEDIKDYLEGRDLLSKEERELPPHSWGIDSK